MSVAVLLVIVLAGVWTLIVGKLSLGQLLLGVVFGTVFVLATGTGRGTVVPVRELPRRTGFLAFYLLVLVPYDVIRSNLQMAKRLLRWNPDIRPGIVREPVGEVPRTAVALEEHGITLSPGQMVVDYAQDQRTVYLHLIDVGEAKGEEAVLWQRYREVLGKVFS